MADAGDLKSSDFGLAGSNPAAPTTKQRAPAEGPFLVRACCTGSNPGGRERPVDVRGRSAAGAEPESVAEGGAARP